MMKARHTPGFLVSWIHVPLLHATAHVRRRASRKPDGTTPSRPSYRPGWKQTEVPLSLTRTLFAVALGLAVAAPTFVAPAAASEGRVVVAQNMRVEMHRERRHEMRHDRRMHRVCKTTVVRKRTPHGMVVRKMRTCR
jgi:hypothetical protein